MPHALFLLVFVLVAAPLAAYIPPRVGPRWRRSTSLEHGEKTRHRRLVAGVARADALVPLATFLDHHLGDLMSRDPDRVRLKAALSRTALSLGGRRET